MLTLDKLIRRGRIKLYGCFCAKEMQSRATTLDFGAHLFMDFGPYLVALEF